MPSQSRRPPNGSSKNASNPELRYANVYPGVDLVYWISGQGLEYDFVAAPGVFSDGLHKTLENATPQIPSGGKPAPE